MKKCFIISPIGEDGSETRKNADEVLEFIIDPACKTKNYEVTRSDKISDNGMITQSIIENLLQADLAIADLTGRNPNVFYELAIRHSYNLPVIQITNDISSIPFDVHNVRTIQYDLSASGAKKAKEEIIKVIESIESGNKSANPISSVASILNLSSESSTNNNTLSELLLKVNSIPEKIDQLENNIGIRFSQMLTAFAQSFNAGSTPVPTEEQIKQKFLESFLTNIMNDPKKGISQMENILSAQKYLEDNGIIKKGDNNV